MAKLPEDDRREKDFFMMEMAYIQKVNSFLNENDKPISNGFNALPGWIDMKNYLEIQVIPYYKQVKILTGIEPDTFKTVLELEAKTFTELWNSLSKVEREKIEEFTKFCDEYTHLFTQMENSND